MGIMGAAEAGLRKLVEQQALRDTCAIIRVTVAQDATTGGYTETSTTYASGIPCRVDSRAVNPTERPIGGRESAVAEYTVSLSMVAARWPGGVVDVRATDRLLVSGDATGTYEVVAPGGPVSDEYLREVQANRIS